MPSLSPSFFFVFFVGGVLSLGSPSAFSLDDIHTSRANARRLPLPKEEGTFHFVIYGDRTGGPAEGIEVLKDAVVDTNLLDPDLVLTVGDLIQGYNEQDAWMEQMIEYREVMGGLHCPWFPVAGNHDIYWRGANRPPGDHEKNYETHFGPLWYWFGFKNAAFFVLYSDEGDLESGAKGYGYPEVNKFSEAQMTWLAEELKNTQDFDHVFVFLHHPKWLNRYPGSNWDDVHAILTQSSNVRAVFAGHIHRMRFDGVRDNIEYYCLATTGGGLSRTLPDAGYLHHLNVVTVREDSFKVATLPIGAVIDPKQMTESHLQAMDALLSLDLTPKSDPISIDAEGRLSSEFIYGLQNPTEAPIEVTYGVVAPDAQWVAIPDHHHQRIEPGQSSDLPLHLTRTGAGLESFDVPKVSVQVDYLASGRRYQLPAFERSIPVRLGEIRRDAFVPGEMALELDGKSALSIPSRTIDIPQGPLTLEAWIHPRSTKGRRGLVTKTENSEFGLFVSNGAPSFCVHIGGRYFEAKGEAGQIKDESWQHIAGVFDAREVRVYLNGKRIASTPIQEGLVERTRNALPFIIGADVNRDGRPTSYFPGQIDELRLSKSSRYSGDSFEPQTRFKPDEHTLLLFHFDRTQGPFHLDHGPSGIHMPPTGSAVIRDRRR